LGISGVVLGRQADVAAEQPHAGQSPPAAEAGASRSSAKEKPGPRGQPSLLQEAASAIDATGSSATNGEFVHGLGLGDRIAEQASLPPSHPRAARRTTSSARPLPYQPPPAHARAGASAARASAAG
jgi:hypothetical protein